MRRHRSRAGQQPASTIRDPSFATPHPAFRIAQTHDAAPQEPRGPATRIHHPRPFIRHTAPHFSHCTDARCGAAGAVRAAASRRRRPATHCASFARTPQAAAASYGRKPQQSATAKPDTSDADSSNHRPGKQAAAPCKKTSVPENPAPMRACFQIVIPRLPRRARPAKQAVT